MPIDFVSLAPTIIVSTGVFLTLLGFFAGELLYQRLRRRHSKLLATLEPAGASNSALASSRRAVGKFIWSGQHRALGDPIVSRWVMFCRSTIIVVGILFLGGLVITIALN
jgi:hypothetical protein